MTPEQYDILFSKIGDYLDSVIPSLWTKEDKTVNDVLNLFFSSSSFSKSDDFWNCLTKESVNSIKEIGAEQFVPLFEGLCANAEFAKEIKGLFKNGKIQKARMNAMGLFARDFMKLGGWKVVMENYLAKYIIDNYQGRVDLGI